MKYATIHAIGEYNPTIIRYVQPTKKTTQQFAEDLMPNLCKVADVYDESMLKIFP